MNPKYIKIVLVVPLYVLLTAVGLAQVCEAFLAHGLYNIIKTSSQNDYETILYDAYCEDNFNMSQISDTSVRSIDAALKYGSFSLGGGRVTNGNRDQVEAARNAFCNSYESSAKGNNNIDLEAKTLFPQALSSFDNCVELESKGLKMVYTLSDPERAKTVTFGLTDTSPGDIVLTGVYINPENAYICEGQIGTTNTKFNKNTTTVIDENQTSMTCVRTTSQNFFEEATISIHTTSKNLDLTFNRVSAIEDVPETPEAELFRRVKELENGLGNLFGTPISRSLNTSYQAPSDGFVWIHASGPRTLGRLSIYSSQPSNNNDYPSIPQIDRRMSVQSSIQISNETINGQSSQITFIKKGEWYRAYKEFGTGQVRPHYVPIGK